MLKLRGNVAVSQKGENIIAIYFYKASRNHAPL